MLQNLRVHEELSNTRGMKKIETTRSLGRFLNNGGHMLQQRLMTHPKVYQVATWPHKVGSNIEQVLPH